MNQIYRPQEEKQEEDSFDTGITIPNTKSVLDRLQEALQKQHQEESEKQGQGKNKKQQQRRGGLICYCGAPGCGIGPMVERQ